MRNSFAFEIFCSSEQETKLFILAAKSSAETTSLVNPLISGIPSKATSVPITGVPVVKLSRTFTFTPAPVNSGTITAGL